MPEIKTEHPSLKAFIYKEDPEIQYHVGYHRLNGKLIRTRIDTKDTNEARKLLDNIKLINSLKNLRDLGNSIIVVEHDRETIESSDFIIDLGPRAGEHGGELCLSGKTNNILRSKNGIDSLTLQYLKYSKKIEAPSKRRLGNGNYIEITGAEGNNLKKISLKIPLGTFTAIT